jgi:hypothetical protein
MARPNPLLAPVTMATFSSIVDMLHSLQSVRFGWVNVPLSIVQDGGGMEIGQVLFQLLDCFVSFLFCAFQSPFHVIRKIAFIGMEDVPILPEPKGPGVFLQVFCRRRRMF